MELQMFIESVLTQLDGAVENARAKTNRDIKFTTNSENRTVEFDIAVTVEQTAEGKAEGGIKVLGIVKAGGDLSASNKNQTVSRIKFGLEIESMTKDEDRRQQAEYDAYNRKIQDQFNNHY